MNVDPVFPNETGPDDDILCRIKDLNVDFELSGRSLRAVDGVSFEIQRGEVIGLVGESGCGKSSLGAALLRLVPPPGQITNGSIEFEGRELTALSEEQMRQLRGLEISLIVQDALAAMNPVTRVGEQIGEVIADHSTAKKGEIRTRVLDMLKEVHLPRPQMNIDRYAHELSGGMQQRVAIAGALILHPKLIVADEPTTALDVTVEWQILRLLREIREETGTSILFITHDLATVLEICDRVMVMYAGQIIESGTVQEIFSDPRHPYTRGLMESLPPLEGDPPEQLKTLEGQPPRPDEWVTGCRFHPRCPLRSALGDPMRCVEEDPAPSGQAHWAACHFVDRIDEMWRSDSDGFV